MLRVMRAAAVAAAVAAVALPGVASAAPPWVDGPTYGDQVSRFDLAVTPDGGVTAAWNQADGSSFVQRTPAGGGASAPRLAVGAGQGPAYAGPVVPGAGGSTLVAYIQMDGPSDLAVRAATVTADGAVGPVVTFADGLGGFATPDLALAGDGAGGAVVGWLGQTPAGVGLFVRRLHADGALGPLVELDTAAGSTADPTIGLLPDGTARVLWLADGTSELMAARLTAAGALDGAPQPISTNDALEPRLAVGAAGAVAAWQEPKGSSSTKRVRIARLPSTGAVAGAPKDVADDVAADNDDVAVALAADGEATVAWSEQLADEPSVGVLRFRRVAADGALGPIAALTEPGEQEDTTDALPRLVAGSGGVLRAVWGRYHDDDGSLRPFSRAIAADGALGPQSEIAPAGHPDMNARSYPTGVDADGSVTVGWGQPTPGGDGTGIVATATIDGAPPKVVAEIPQHVVAGEPAFFRAIATDPSGIASVRWGFGDGSGADGAEITRAYAHPGEYEGSVTVTDRVGNVTVVRQLVTVAAAPPPTPPVPPTPPAPPTSPVLPQVGGRDDGVRRPSAGKAFAALRLAAVRRQGARVRVTGTISRRARGWVTVVWSQRSGRGTIRRTARARIVRGRFVATVRLPRALVRSRARAHVTLTYAGDATTRAAKASKRVAPPRRGVRR